VQDAFLICSSTNLDSLASFYQAARRNGMYLYIYNDYVCQQLRTFTELAGAKTDLYRFEKAYVLRPDQELHQKA
jgi:ribonuclease J